MGTSTGTTVTDLCDQINKMMTEEKEQLAKELVEEEDMHDGCSYQLNVLKNHDHCSM